jgi:IstB-like ATP binding protein
MERTEVLDLMSGLKLHRMRSAYDETSATALKRKHEPQRFVGDLLKAEISEKQARSIKYQLTVAKLPLAKDVGDFAFKDTPINEAIVRDLAGGGFIAQQRNVVLVGGTGTGKTHLAIAVARSCVRAGSRGRFFTPSISSISSSPKVEPDAKDASPTASPASTSSSSMNSAISCSHKPAANCCSISSAGFTGAPRSSSPPISLSANGRACSPTRR